MGVSSVSFSPDSKTLASGSYDKTVRIFNLEDGTCQKVLTLQPFRVTMQLNVKPFVTTPIQRSTTSSQSRSQTQARSMKYLPW